VVGATTRGARFLRLFRRLRLPIAILVVAWLFAPPSIRDAIPLWLPFLVVLLLEAQFVLANYRDTEPFFGSPDRRPGAADRDRYGTGELVDWAIVDDEGERVWVDLREPDEEDEAPTPPAASAAAPGWSLRRLARSLGEALAVLAVVAGLLLFFDRGSWDELDAEARRAAESRFSAEATRVAGKPVRIRCDTSGRHVGAVQHADGVAVVGGDRAFLTPELCFALYELAFDGEMQSFSRTGRAVAVLAHESWHLRGVRREGVTECYALQSGVDVAIHLGLDEGEARRMMRSQLVANQLHGGGSAEYVVPPECINRGRYDLHPSVDRFP
jgi:hypothetical protein